MNMIGYDLNQFQATIIGQGVAINTPTTYPASNGQILAWNIDGTVAWLTPYTASGSGTQLQHFSGAVTGSSVSGANVTLGGTLTIGSLTSGRIPFVSTGGLLADAATFFRDSSTGKVFVGASTAYSRLPSPFEITNSANYGGLAMSTFSATAAHCPSIEFHHSKSDTIGTHAAVANGDALAAMQMCGSNGSNFVTSVAMFAYVDGVPSGSGVPGKIEFYTNPNGTQSVSLALTLNSSQNAIFAQKVGVGTGSTVSARLHSLSTTEQLRLGYDVSNYYSTTVGSTGGVTFDAVGSGAAFTFSDRVTFNSSVSLGVQTELTIIAGVITKTKPYHSVDTEADAASDDLTTINGGVEGDILVLRANDSGRTVVVKDGAGNIFLDGSVDCSLDNARDKIVLIHNGTDWDEITRSNNSA